MSLRGWEARRQRQEAIRIALEEPDKAPLEYAALRLVRVRKQLDRIDDLLMAEKDPAKLDRLAAASMRLSDQEFALANRPKPGQTRPAPDKPQRRGWLDAVVERPPGLEPAPPDAIG